MATPLSHCPRPQRPPQHARLVLQKVKHTREEGGGASKDLTNIPSLCSYGMQPVKIHTQLSVHPCSQCFLCSRTLREGSFQTHKETEFFKGVGASFPLISCGSQRRKKASAKLLSASCREAHIEARTEGTQLRGVRKGRSDNTSSRMHGQPLEDGGEGKWAEFTDSVS